MSLFILRVVLSHPIKCGSAWRNHKFGWIAGGLRKKVLLDIYVGNCVIMKNYVSIFSSHALNEPSDPGLECGLGPTSSVSHGDDNLWTFACTAYNLETFELLRLHVAGARRMARGVGGLNAFSLDRCLKSHKLQLKRQKQVKQSFKWWHEHARRFSIVARIISVAFVLGES